MADEENDKESKDNVQMHNGKSFDNSKLQQIKSENDIPQADETTDLHNLTYQSEKQQSNEDLLKNQNMLEREPINVGIRLEFPFTHHAESTVLRNQNAFQQENNSCSQQPFIAPNFEASDEIESQQQVPLEFENYANKILEQKLVQPFIESGNITAGTIKDQIVDNSGLSKTTNNFQDQQAINNEIPDISESPDNFQQELKTEERAHFAILQDDATCDVIGGLNNIVNDSEREPHLPTMEYQELEKLKFWAKHQIYCQKESTDDDERSDQILLNLQSTQAVEKSEHLLNQIHDEYRELLASEKLQEQILYEEQENIINELKKNSEFMKVEITKAIILSDKDEIDVPVCLTASNEDKEILSLLDSSKVREEKRRKLAVEKEIIMADNNERHVIEISGLMPSKPSEAVEVSLKVQPNISEQDIMIDLSKDSGNPHENIERDSVSSLKMNVLGTKNDDTVNSSENIEEDTVPPLNLNTLETQDDDSHENIDESMVSSLRLNASQDEDSVNSHQNIKETVSLLKPNASETKDEDSHENLEENTVPSLRMNVSEIQGEDSVNSHENIEQIVPSLKSNSLERQDEDSHENIEESSLKPNALETQNENLINSHKNIEEGTVPLLKPNASEMQNEDSDNCHQNIEWAVRSLPNVSEIQNEDSVNPHENIKDGMISSLKLNVSETKVNTAVGIGKTIAVENEDKNEGINENDEEMILSEKEKSVIKLERNDNDNKSQLQMRDEMMTSSEMKAAVLAGSDSVQHLQSESGTNIAPNPKHGQEKLRTNDNLRHNKHYHQKGPFGGMYSDIMEECKYNNTGKNSLHKYQPQQEYSGIFDNVELQGNHQQQQSGNQNHARKQQQQQDGSNRGYNQNYSGQQVHRKRNKRNKKPRIWS
ncbi:hypothetical protein DINM_003027 [Dirofilaria immitis]|nr:hypothetical protein [Dirofilaria immitis]